MPRKLRAAKRRIEGVSETALWVMGDSVLYPEPAETNNWELFNLEYLTTAWDGSRSLWDSARDQVLDDWIDATPGTRPSWWWHFDAPRMSAEELARRGWAEAYFAARLPDPRRRLGGLGTPRHEVLNYVPTFHCGIPASWVDQGDVDLYNGRKRDVHGQPINANGRWFEGHFRGIAIDPEDPPTFEAQANYLKRRGLFAPGEERRLQPSDYEPESVTIEDEIEDEDNSSSHAGQTPAARR